MFVAHLQTNCVLGTLESSFFSALESQYDQLLDKGMTVNFNVKHFIRHHSTADKLTTEYRVADSMYKFSEFKYDSVANALHIVLVLSEWGLMVREVCPAFLS